MTDNDVLRIIKENLTLSIQNQPEKDNVVSIQLYLAGEPIGEKTYLVNGVMHGDSYLTVHKEY